MRGKKNLTYIQDAFFNMQKQIYHFYQMSVQTAEEKLYKF